MIRLNLEGCSGNYGADVYSVKWIPSGDGTLEELIDDINRHYDHKGESICNGSTIDIYSSRKAMKDDWLHPTMRLKIQRHTFFDISNVDPETLNLEVRCKNVIGSWGSDTWYVYFPAHYELPACITPSTNTL